MIDLGQFSDTVIVAALFVFVLALVAFAAEWAFGSAGGISRATAAESPEAAVPTARSSPASTTGPPPISAGFTASAPGHTVVLERRLVPAEASVQSYPTGHGPDGPIARPGRGRRGATAGAVGGMLLALAVLLDGAGVVTRGIAAERVPWGNLYEFSITGVFAVTGAHLLMRSRLKLQFLDVWLTGFAVTCLAAALIGFHEVVGPLNPSLQSGWLIVHVSFAVLATGILTVGAVLAGLYLFRSSREAAGRSGDGYVSRLPAASALDRMSYRVHGFAFPLYTLALIFGAVWAKAAYGRYWEWDPKETWMLISWVLYAAYLHARATAGWKGKIAAVIALVAFGTVLFNLLGVNFLIAGKHSYAN